MRREGDAELGSSVAFWDAKPLLQVAVTKIPASCFVMEVVLTIPITFAARIVATLVAKSPDAAYRRLTRFPNVTEGEVCASPGNAL